MKQEINHAKPESQEKVLDALKNKEGKATLGEIIVATGLPKGETEAAVRDLLREYESHLAVDENGEILYLFSPSFLRRGSRDRFSRAYRAFLSWLWKAFVVGFKIAIMVILVAYFVLFVALVIAAIVAALSSRGDSNSSSSSSSSNRSGGLPFYWLYWFWGGPRSSSYNDGYYNRHNYNPRSKQKAKDPRPFYKKVFSFVFGPELPALDPLYEERALLSWIRNQKGRFTAADLASRTGHSLNQAEEEATKLIVDYGGDVEVTDEGVLVYTLTNLLIEAGGRKGDVSPKQAYWKELELPLSLTGNQTSTNVLVFFFNAFTLLAALIAPYFIFPALNLSGTAVWVGLFYVPIIFSTMFFAVPFFRWLQNRKKTKERAMRNLRRASLQVLYQAAIKKPLWLEPKNAAKEITKIYQDKLAKAGVHAETYAYKAFSSVGFDSIEEDKAKKEVEYLLHHFEGSPISTKDGQLVYEFDRLSLEILEGARVRKEANPEEAKLGQVVYRSDE